MHIRPAAALVLAALTTTTLACRPPQAAPMTDDEIARATEGQPRIFLVDERGLTLEGAEQFYLGQDEAQALEELDRLCGKPEVYDGGWRHKGAVFKGCIIENGPEVRTVRVGFWPHNGNRVSTLEVKHKPLPYEAVRARFTQTFGADALVSDVPRHGALIMATEQYKLFAHWDEGIDSPTHVTVGFEPVWVEKNDP